MQERTGHILEFSDTAMAVAWIAALEREAISQQWENFWADIGKNGSTKNPVTRRWMWVRRRTHKKKLTGSPGWIKKHYRDGRREKYMKEAMAKLEAAVNSGEVPAIPQRPEEIITAGFAQRLRVNLRTVSDIKVVEVMRTQMQALVEFYIKDKARRLEVQAAARFCEFRLGQLLGPPPGAGRGRGNKTLDGFNLLSPQERVVFRRMAEHPDVFQTCIDKGHVTRSAILSAIEQSTTATIVEPTTTPEPKKAEPTDVEEMVLCCIGYLRRVGANLDEMIEVAKGIEEQVKIMRANELVAVGLLRRVATQGLRPARLGARGFAGW
jgi:hypothetical protein